MDNARETTACPCYKLATTLGDGDNLPNHVCERTARDATTNWAKQFRIASPHYTADTPAEGLWLIPVGEYRYVELGNGKPNESVLWPPRLRLISEPMPHGTVCLPLRQWVEVPDEKLPELWEAHYRTIFELCKEETQQIVRRREQNRQRIASSPGKHPRTIELELKRFDSEMPSLSEEIRKFVLTNSGLPVTPGTSRYLLSFTASEKERLENPIVPTRGALVTSLLVIPTAYRSELNGEVIQTVELCGAFSNSNEVFVKARQVCQAHTNWWQQQFSDFTVHTTRKVNKGRQPFDSQIKEDIRKVLNGEMSEAEAKNHARRRRENQLHEKGLSFDASAQEEVDKRFHTALRAPQQKTSR